MSGRGGKFFKFGKSKKATPMLVQIRDNGKSFNNPGFTGTKRNTINPGELGLSQKNPITEYQLLRSLVSRYPDRRSLAIQGLHKMYGRKLTIEDFKHILNRLDITQNNGLATEFMTKYTNTGTSYWQSNSSEAASLKQLLNKSRQKN